MTPLYTTKPPARMLALAFEEGGVGVGALLGTIPAWPASGSVSPSMSGSHIVRFCDRDLAAIDHIGADSE